MIQRLKAWLRARQIKAAERRFQSGYNFAAGALLSGTSTDEVATLADNPFDYDEFDGGMRDALADWATFVQFGVLPP